MTNLLPLEALRAFPVARRIAEAAGQPVPPTWQVERLAHPARLAVHVGNTTLARPRKRRFYWAALFLWLGVPVAGWALIAALGWALLP